MSKKNRNFSKVNGKVTSLPNIKLVEEVKKTTSKNIGPDVTQLSLTAEEAGRIKILENAVLNTKLQLADLEVNLMVGQTKKNELIQFISLKSQEMINEVRKVASDYGIDVDGVSDSRKWNFDTSEMIFKRVP